MWLLEYGWKVSKSWGLGGGNFLERIPMLGDAGVPHLLKVLHKRFTCSIGLMVFCRVCWSVCYAQLLEVDLEWVGRSRVERRTIVFQQKFGRFP